MSSEALEILRRVHIFTDLDDNELFQIVGMCRVWNVPQETVIFQEGQDGHELFIIQYGSVRVSLNTRGPEGEIVPAVINILSTGQSFGEMVLLDGVTRSATVVSAEDCILLVLKASDFEKLCNTNPRIGYVVMRNVASDVAYKLRSSNLLLRGNIRWKHGELARRSA
jgi:CRP/FNR family transcriptional regulator, cyclic AMP receptor protein